MTETMTDILAGLDPGYRVFLLLGALAFAAFVVAQLVALVRVVLNRETIDSDGADPQLTEVIERLDSLCEYAHDTFGVLDEWQRDGSVAKERDDNMAADVADIADGIRVWRESSVLPIALDAVADARAHESRRAALKLDGIRLGGQP